MKKWHQTVFILFFQQGRRLIIDSNAIWQIRHLLVKTFHISFKCLIHFKSQQQKVLQHTSVAEISQICLFQTTSPPPGNPCFKATTCLCINKFNRTSLFYHIFILFLCQRKKTSVWHTLYINQTMTLYSHGNEVEPEPWSSAHQSILTAITH